MKIETFSNIEIAYMCNIGPYGIKNKELMENFKEYLVKHDLFDEGTIIVGIALDNHQIVSSEELRYYVGLIIDEDNCCELPKRKIDDGSYAIFEIEHTKEVIVDFFMNVEKLNLEIDFNRPIVERYAVTKINRNLCEMCIPIK